MTTLLTIIIILFTRPKAAISAARRIEHSGNQLLPAGGPIPPGVAGFDEKLRNPWMRHDVEKAKKLLAEAGFPGGVDPATGRRLKFTFDQTGHTSSHRQFGEITAAEFADRSVDFAHKITDDDLCCRLFRSRGFQWGGAWNSVKDYQHFEKK